MIESFGARFIETIVLFRGSRPAATVLPGGLFVIQPAGQRPVAWLLAAAATPSAATTPAAATSTTALTLLLVVVSAPRC